MPSDRAGVLDGALTVLEDWAGGALFEPAAIERQRAIVLAEWRRSLGASERTAEKCAARSWRDRATQTGPRSGPVGDRDRAARTAGAVLSRLVPDLMAVIVVGDVDNAVAAMIRQHFSSLVNPEPERPRPIFDVPERPGTLRHRHRPGARTPS